MNMLKIGFAVCMASGLVLLSGCGGSGTSSTPPNPPSISTKSLPAATVGVAYSQSLTATGGTPPYMWSISSGSLPSGLSLGASTGVISGTPTGAAGTDQFTVTVSDVASTVMKATANLSIVVNSSSVGLLKGNYAFIFSGNFNGFFTGAGSFVADGAGNITNGIVDTNGLTGPTINGGFSGTYSLDANNLGSMNWVFTGSGGGASTYALSLSSDGNARFIQYDSRGVQGAGVIKRQDTSAFSAGKISGNYAFGLDGIDGPASHRMAVIGEMTSDGVSNFSNGLVDANTNGTILAASPMAGTYLVAANGRGTATLTITGVGALSTSFYVVSATEFFVMEIDTVSAGHPLLNGDVVQQAGGFSSASLSGSSVIAADALPAPASPAVTLGLITQGSAGMLSLNADVNSGGTLSSETSQLNYSVAGGGRVTTTGSNPPTFYLSNQDQGFVLFPDSAVTFGTIRPQASGPFTNASLSGTYAGGSTTLGAPELTEVDAWSADGNGNISETFNTSDGTNLQPGSQNFTYAMASNGRAPLLTSQGVSAGIVYVVSSSEAIALGATAPSLRFFEH